MHSAGKTHFNISEKIEAGFKYFDLFKLFLLELKEALNPYWQKIVSKSKKEYENVSNHWTIWDTVFGLLAAALIFCSLLVLASGFVIFAYQVFIWLESGLWEEIPLLVAFNFVFQNTTLHQWILNPESWFGLHQIITWTLENVPLSLTLMIEGIMLTGFFSACIVMAIFIRLVTMKNLKR